MSCEQVTSATTRWPHSASARPRTAASSMAALTVATLVAVGCVADPGPTAGATLTAATSTVGVVDGSVVRVSVSGGRSIAPGSYRAFFDDVRFDAAQ